MALKGNLRDVSLNQLLNLILNGSGAFKAFIKPVYPFLCYTVIIRVRYSQQSIGDFTVTDKPLNIFGIR